MLWVTNKNAKLCSDHIKSNLKFRQVLSKYVTCQIFNFGPFSLLNPAGLKQKHSHLHVGDGVP